MRAIHRVRNVAGAAPSTINERANPQGLDPLAARFLSRRGDLITSTGKVDLRRLKEIALEHASGPNPAAKS